MTQQENLISAQIDGGLHEKQSLLDDFAKAAMQGELAAQSESDYGLYTNDEANMSLLARRCYDIAEAMMQERERRIKG